MRTSSTPLTSAFTSELAIRPAVQLAARELLVKPDELWVFVDEHQIYGRIPDVVAARVNTAALEARLQEAGSGRSTRQSCASVRCA
jgi:hypothetical protein